MILYLLLLWVAGWGVAVSIVAPFCIGAVVGFERVGRILWWREGVGYSFSDLSCRGPRRGFPHIFSIRIEPVDAGRCRVHVRVRGLWTARAVPRFIVRQWLRWVFAHVMRSLDTELLIYRLWRKQNATSAAAQSLVAD